MQSYGEVIAYLFARLPMFTRDGVSAYKEDLTNTLALCAALGNPQDKFKAIHVAGTNGKGSSSHMLAAVLASSGLKTGLYTSPHLVDFRERIRIDGVMMPQQEVIDFVIEHQALIEAIQPSFFEVTVALAFAYFAREKVDIAIIEVGLGGRLDSTNVILPELSLITNIGMDHMNLLGNSLAEIAAEKAGIIKAHRPVVVSQRQEELVPIFTQKALAVDAPLIFATDAYQLLQADLLPTKQQLQIQNIQSQEIHTWTLDLMGSYQKKNILGVLCALDVLRDLGYQISDEDIQNGLSAVQKRTGLQGRWELLSQNPLIICDTGHNADGIREVVANLAHTNYNKLHMVIGAMRDKDLQHMLPLLPPHAHYYFCNADSPRALPAAALAEEAFVFGLVGQAYPSITLALAAAKTAYQAGDLIFVGGSNFVVAEVLTTGPMSTL